MDSPIIQRPIPILMKMWSYKDADGIEVFLPPCLGIETTMDNVFERMLLHMWNRGNPIDMRSYLYCSHLLNSLKTEPLSVEESVMKMYFFMGTFGMRYGFFFLWKMAHKTLAWKAALHLIICAQTLRMQTYQKHDINGVILVDEYMLPWERIDESIRIASRVLTQAFN